MNDIVRELYLHYLSERNKIVVYTGKEVSPYLTTIGNVKTSGYNLNNTKSIEEYLGSI